jgi:translation initiation factor 4E
MTVVQLVYGLDGRSAYPTIPEAQKYPLTTLTINSSSKLSLSMNKTERNDHREGHETTSAKRFGSLSSKNNPFNAAAATSATSVASPTGSGASSAFGLGSGAFASFGSASKTPKTPGTAFDFSKPSSEKKEQQSSDKEEKESRRPPARKSLSSLRPSESSIATPKDVAASWPLKHTWVIHYRPPTGKNSDYEKSMKPLCKINTAQAFWTVYTHLKRPSSLPTVSDYHFFKEGIRPVWEDEENKHGGKWTMRLKKGVADRYWEDLLLALIGDQFAEASEEVCGAVVSVRSGEDVFSIWTKNDGGRNVKIRETVKRVLSLPADTNLQWRSHDDSIGQRNAVDQARQEKASYSEKRRNTLTASSVEKIGKEESA